MSGFRGRKEGIKTALPGKTQDSTFFMRPKNLNLMTGIASGVAIVLILVSPRMSLSPVISIVDDESRPRPSRRSLPTEPLTQVADSEAETDRRDPFKRDHPNRCCDDRAA